MIEIRVQVESDWNVGSLGEENIHFVAVDNKWNGWSETLEWTELNLHWK